MLSIYLLLVSTIIFIALSQINISNNNNNNIGVQQRIVKQLPSCQRFDITKINNTNGNKKMVKIKVILFDNAQIQFTKNDNIYIATNFNSQIQNTQIHKQHMKGQSPISNNQFVINLTSQIIKLGHIQLFVIIKQSNQELNQPLILCLHHQKQQLIHPISSAKLYTFLSNPLTNFQTSIYYILPSFTHFLNLHIKIQQGYPLLIPYICRQYNFKSCLSDMKIKITKTNTKYKQSKYHMFSNIVLNQQEIVQIDYCQKCYWIIYIQGKIGKNLVQIWFGTNKQIVKDQDEKDKQLELKENRFSRLDEGMYQYYYTTVTDSQLVYMANWPLQTLYYTCSHQDFTIKLNLGTKKTTLILIPGKDNFQPIKCSFYAHSQKALLGQSSTLNQKQHQKSKELQSLYYTNMYLRSLKLSNSYPSVLTRSHTGLFHFTLNQASVYLNIRKCIDAPINLKYYFLPDFDAIKNRISEQGEQSKQDQDWVFKKQIRIVSNLVSIKINKNQNIYDTKYLIVEIMPDSYSFLEITMSKQKQFKQNSKNSVNLLQFTKQQYLQKQSQIQFLLKFIIKSEQIQKKHIINNIKIIESHKPDPIQLDIYCPNILFHQYQTKNNLQQKDIRKSDQQKQKQKQKTKTIVQQISKQQYQVTIQGKSQFQYLGISININQNLSYKVIELKSKINLIDKYKILLIICLGCILLIFVGTAKLLQTKPKKNSQ